MRNIGEETQFKLVHLFDIVSMFLFIFQHFLHSDTAFVNSVQVPYRQNQNDKVKHISPNR